MARTKQTARKCLVPQYATKSCRKKLKISKNKKSKRSRNGAPDSQSQSEEELNQVNNQQFSVKFDDQAKCEEHCVTARIIQCSNCESVFTSQSKSYSKSEYVKLIQNPKLSDEQKQKYKNFVNSDSVWICEFCRTLNSIPKSYKVPTTENPCFLIEKKKKSSNKSSFQQNDDQNKILLFCIDVSGSMDQKVAGSKTRLDTVKEAIIDEINRMNAENQVIKVGLVTFGSWVSLIGDGKTFKQKKLDTSLYKDFNAIVKECNKINKFTSPIKKSHGALKKRIQMLNDNGSTALGPGLLASIQIASKGSVGSKVIICTDGEANVGLGSSWGENSSDFYEKAANFAKDKRVSVSVLSLKGDKCNLKQLGKLSLASGGSILKIDPRALGTQFSKIAKQQILGSQSQLVIKVNKIFEIISHNPIQLSADRTTLTQNFGSFSDQTQLTFEFKVLTKQQASKKAGVDLLLYDQQKVPMQIQLTYVGRDGQRYKQIITDWRQLTENQKEIYDGANFGLFAASILQRASAKIKSSEFKQAEGILKGYWSITNQKFSKTQTAAELTKFGDRVKKLETILKSKHHKSGKSLLKKTTKKAATKSPARIKKTQKKKKIIKNRKANVSPDSESENSSSRGDLEEGMSSDEEEQILWKQMRARSRSNSPEVDKRKARKNKK